MHPTFCFGVNQIKRLDYDEFNAVLSLQTANFEIVQVPLFHRNTTHFMGMAERSYYLCFKRKGDSLYALDRNNTLSQWSALTGELLARTPVPKADYRSFDVDREVYDRDWFGFTLIYKNLGAVVEEKKEVDGVEDAEQAGQRLNKII